MTSSELYPTDINPCPSGAETKVIANCDAELRAARWRPHGDAKGTVILAHGRTEFTEKYFEVICELLARGYVVFTFDWRGQGLATRELEEWQRGHIDDFDDFLGDLDCIFADEFFAACPSPRYVLAHSMGGNIMMRYLHDHPEIADRAVLSAPMLRFGSGIQVQALRLFASAASAIGRGNAEPFVSKPQPPAEQTFEKNPVTSDPERYERTRATVIAHPPLGVAGLSWQWLKAASASIEEIWRDDFMGELKTPVLLLAAGREKLVDPKGCRDYAARAEVCEAVTIEGALHEIMMERDPFRRQFWALFDEFLSRP